MNAPTVRYAARASAENLRSGIRPAACFRGSTPRTPCFPRWIRQPARSRLQRRPGLCRPSAAGKAAGGSPWCATGLRSWKLIPSKGTFLGNPVEGKAHMTMNDGAVGPDGRFYAGSLNVD